MTSSLAAVMLAAVVGQPISTPIEVPFTLTEDAIVIGTTVNGRKVQLMFDTGYAGSVVLNDSINVGPVTGTQRLQDFVGTMEARTAALKSMQIGARTINPAGKDIVLLPMDDLSESYGVHCDGILGFEAVKDDVVEINFQRSRLIFHPKTLDISTRKPDEKSKFLGRMLPIGGNAIMMDVTTSTGGKMILSLDTGNAFYATTHRDVLQRVGLWTEGRQPKFTKLSGVASGPVESWYKRMNDLRIYGVPVKTSVWSIIDLPSSSAEGDGTIGFGFLSNFNITIDYDRRRVWMENFTGKVESDNLGDIGISAAFDERIKRVRVYRVSPDSPAATAGILAGDTILSIDSRDLFDGDFRTVSRLLEGPVGSEVKLAVSRSGALKRYDLKRVPLVNEPSN
jgi:hypothetical protein